MKTKKSSFGKAFLSKKRFALVQIAIVLCSLFVVALPAVAAEQNHAMQKVSAVTTVSEDDFILDIYGNANEDDTIDMGDVVYTKLAIFGKKPKTELCDAKYDGRINVLDVIQTKLIILGKEKELTIVDSKDIIVTVKKPIKRIVVFQSGAIEMMRSLKAKDKIVGVTESIIQKKIFHPEFGDYPNIGSSGSPNYEVLLNCEPDVVFLYATFSLSNCEAIENRLKELDPSITVVHFDCFKMESYTEEVEKLGYILGRKKEANEYIDFYEGWVNSIKERVEGEDRPRIYFEGRTPYQTGGIRSSWHMSAERAGGNNIFSDLSGYFKVDAEEVISQNPEIIVRMISGRGVGYVTDDSTELSKQRDELMSRPELASVIAVKKERVYIAAWDIIDRAHVVGVAYMAKWFHPELFEDLDPQAIHQEYLTRFQGLDYDLNKRGAFVYPEPS